MTKPTLRGLAAVAAAMAVVLTGALVAAAPAQAQSTPQFAVAASDGGASRISGGLSNCPYKRMCVWESTVYRNRGASFEFTFYAWSTLRAEIAYMNNRASSKANNGEPHTYDFSCIYSGNNHTGDYFGISRGFAYQYLSDFGMNNRASSNRWRSSSSC